MKDLRLNTPFMRKNGQNFFLINGRWATEKEYNRVRPMPEYKKYNEKGITIGNLIK
jgi:hypothetical protein